MILMEKKLLGRFMKTNCKKQIKKKKKNRSENLIKRKVDKLYVKWEGYDSLFNSWINKKDIV